MKQIMISTYSYQPQVQEYIGEQLGQLIEKKYIPNINIEEKNKLTFLTCTFPQSMSLEEQEMYFKEYMVIPIARAMVKVIQNEFAVCYANKVIETDFNLKTIKVARMMQHDREARELLIPIVDTIIEKNTFSLDGWISFRLSKYKECIVEAVDKFIFRYDIYKEYQEFVYLLKEFIEQQESLIELVHIVADSNGEITLFDGQYEKLTRRPIKDQELLLGTLLNILPANITIHQGRNYKNVHFIDMIKEIYQEKITTCIACGYCNSPSLNQRIKEALKGILTPKKL